MTKLTFTADVELQAAADGGKQPRVSILAYTGGVMRVPSYGAVALDLSGMELAQIPLLADHENSLQAIAGTGLPEVRDGELHVSGVLATGTAAGDQILALHRSGVKLQASLGAEPVEQQFIDAGETATVNGRNITASAGGFLLVTRSHLREVSIVANGADSQTTVSIAAKRKRAMAKHDEFRNLLGTMLPTTRIDDMTQLELANCHAQLMRGESIANADDIAAVADMPEMIHASADPVANEQRRIRQGDRATAGKFHEDLQPRVAELRASYKRGERSLEDLIEEMRPIHAENDEMHNEMQYAALPPRVSKNVSVDGKVAEAAICLKGGLANIESHFDERTLEAAYEYSKGLTPKTMLMQGAVANGYPARIGESPNDGNLRAVLDYSCRPIRASSGWSSYSVPNILTNTANRFIEQGFVEVGDEWRSISEIKSVSNFKEHSWVRLLDDLEYEEVPKGGEIPHGTLGDDTMTGSAGTFGVMCSIPRTDIINDDLSAFTDLPRRIGRSAGQKLRRLFWTLFNSADSFFDASNGNLTDGALTDDGADLTEVLKAFRAMRSPAADGAKLLGGKPAVMLVSPNDEIVARRLLNSSNIVAGGGSSVTTIGSGNPFAGLAELVIVDWLIDESLGGTADTNEFYLFRDPRLLPAMLVLALNGRIEPTVETAQPSFNVLGIEMRGYSDIGVSRGEPLAGMKASGDPIGT